MIRATLYFLLLPNFSFQVRLKHKYWFRSRKKGNYYFAFNKSSHFLQHNEMAAKAKVRLKLLDVFEEFEHFNNFVDMNGSIYR